MVKVQKDLQTTSIVVTHDIESALMVADRIILLHDGKIVVDSPKNKVFAVDNLILQEFIYGWDEMRVLRSKGRLEHEVYR